MSPHIMVLHKVGQRYFELSSTPLILVWLLQYIDIRQIKALAIVQIINPNLLMATVLTL